MKVRITIIEADDVGTSDIRELIGRAFGAKPAAVAVIEQEPPRQLQAPEPRHEFTPEPRARRAPTPPMGERITKCRECGTVAPHGTDGRTRCQCGGRWKCSAVSELPGGDKGGAAPINGRAVFQESSTRDDN